MGSFLDPTLTKDGVPFNLWMYDRIIQERYAISKNIHTSYNDTGKITPHERRRLIELINEDVERMKKQFSSEKPQVGKKGSN